jgi:hypothetical protein
MVDLVMRAAKELGLVEHVSVRELSETADPVVTVSYPPKAVQARIPFRYFAETDLRKVRFILSDLAKMAQR